MVLTLDKSRVEYNGEKPGVFGSVKKRNEHSVFSNDNRNEKNVESNPEGRFPANFIHDGSEEVLKHFPNTKGLIGATNDGIVVHKPKDALGISKVGNSNIIGGIPDEGSAARFFYCAKVGKKERNIGCDGTLPIIGDLNVNNKENRIKEFGKLGEEALLGNYFYEEAAKDAKANGQLLNTHPTVKPVKLMSYLVNLITPEGGTVLDPFCGSGSTGMACKQEGFNFIGIELDEDYVNIAKARIDGWK